MTRLFSTKYSHYYGHHHIHRNISQIGLAEGFPHIAVTAQGWMTAAIATPLPNG